MTVHVYQSARRPAEEEEKEAKNFCFSIFFLQIEVKPFLSCSKNLGSLFFSSAFGFVPFKYICKDILFHGESISWRPSLFSIH